VILGRLDDRVIDRIVAETRGNPLALLELPHGLAAGEPAGGFGVSPSVPVLAQIEGSFLQRLGDLPAATQRLVLLAAAEPVGDPVLLLRAGERLGLGVEAAAPAEVAGLPRTTTINRAGLRPHQAQPQDLPLQLPRQAGSARRVAINHDDPQPHQAPPPPTRHGGGLNRPPRRSFRLNETPTRRTGSRGPIGGTFLSSFTRQPPRSAGRRRHRSEVWLRARSGARASIDGQLRCDQCDGLLERHPLALWSWSPPLRDDASSFAGICRTQTKATDL
jgi:hypothetical protein